MTNRTDEHMTRTTNQTIIQETREEHDIITGGRGKYMTNRRRDYENFLIVHDVHAPRMFSHFTSQLKVTAKSLTLFTQGC